MWLAHHHPDQYDRCVVIAGRPVCRRCLVLYPVALIVLGLALAGVRWPHGLDAVLLIVLPMPGVAEFVLEHVGAMGYRPAFQAVVTIPLAAALGVGFDRYFHRHTDPLFWGIVAAYGGVCLIAVLVGSRRSPE
jgi:hypothetical protein